MTEHERNRRANLPVGHPYRITLGKYHPNTLKIPALQSVRSLGHHARAVKEGSCFEENTNWAAKTSCRERTSDICVDLSHGQVTYQCNKCHDKARQVVGRAVISIAKSLRAYACYICAITFNAERFTNSQFNVWGLPLDALDGYPSISRGPPQQMTGCMCGTKLMDHTLCTPHRAHHFLEVRAKADALRAFVVATFGHMVCPFCNLNPGADTTNFLDQEGNPYPQIAYLCMACLGWIVADPATHPTIDAPSWDNARLLLELQQ
ncbi:hypothetical protein EV127DRAFT_417918 [Xylaria flabelliformis]|nr:hypothetical protein EV127DRAFT_417918 [Xylaria flabelliformis]